MKNSIYFNNSFMGDVGFDLIKELLSNSCKFEENKSYFLELLPTSNQDILEQNLSQTEELFNLLFRKENLVEAHIKNIRHSILSISKKGEIIDSDDLDEIRNMLECFGKIKKHANKQKLALWKAMISIIHFPKEIISLINKILDSEGNIKDGASRALKNIINQINKTQALIENKINDELEKYFKLGYLNENRIVYRDRKMLLPVNSSSKNKIKGVVVDYSATRQTCYIQPLSIVELNNKVRILLSEKKKEIINILKKITSEMNPSAKNISDIYAFMKLYDARSTVAHFAIKFDAIKPEFSKQLLLKKAINPIFTMNEKGYIPLDISIKDNIRSIIISGPNSGGKTVVIKSIGLYAMMAQCGLFIPANKAKIPVFKSFLSDIGDRQSLSDDLSTFSAHMKQISHIVNKCSKTSLIIIDEMGTGTAPDIGSSLSIAILNHLTSKKPLTLCTTHLTPLKVWADENVYAENASMDFDDNNIEPTFIFKAGIPGSSYGVEIAERMGIDRDIITEARRNINNETFDLEKIIKKINEKEKELDKKIADAENRIKELDTDKREVLKLKNELNAKLSQIKKENQSDVKNYLTSYRKKMEFLIENIKKNNADTSSINEAKSFISSNISEIEIEEKREENNNFIFSVGEIVTVKDINENGEIIQIDKNNNVVLIIDNKKLTIKASGILPVAGKPNDAKEKKYISKNNVSHIETTTIDLRGQRVVEAIMELDKFLDRAILSNLKSVDILHGTGTGALQEAIHSHLKNLNHIEDFRFAPIDQGGMGITIVDL